MDESFEVLYNGYRQIEEVAADMRFWEDVDGVEDITSKSKNTNY